MYLPFEITDSFYLIVLWTFRVTYRTKNYKTFLVIQNTSQSWKTHFPTNSEQAIVLFRFTLGLTNFALSLPFPVPIQYKTWNVLLWFTQSLIGSAHVYQPDNIFQDFIRFFSFTPSNKTYNFYIVLGALFYRTDLNRKLWPFRAPLYHIGLCLSYRVTV